MKNKLLISFIILFIVFSTYCELFEQVSQSSLKFRYLDEKIEFKYYDDLRFRHIVNEQQYSLFDLQKVNFNRLTKWNNHNRLLSEKIFELGAKPGKEISKLHNNGITGKGITVAIIDQNLAGYHPEFSNSIIKYTDMGCNTPSSEGSMHGPAVTSLLVGKNMGTAPDAKIYYYAAPSWLGDGKYYSDALYKIIELNKELQGNNKIRAVSVSASPGGQYSPFSKNTDLWLEAVSKAEENNILVFDCTSENNFIGPGYFELEKEKIKEHIISGWPNGSQFNTKNGKVTVPCSYRTVAEEYNKNEYSYYYCSVGGLSWSIPYACGVSALVWQIDPTVTAGEMKELFLLSAYKTKNGDSVINPEEMISIAKKNMH